MAAATGGPERSPIRLRRADGEERPGGQCDQEAPQEDAKAQAAEAPEAAAPQEVGALARPAPASRRGSAATSRSPRSPCVRPRIRSGWLLPCVSAGRTHQPSNRPTAPPDRPCDPSCVARDSCVPRRHPPALVVPETSAPHVARGRAIRRMPRASLRRAGHAACRSLAPSTSRILVTWFADRALDSSHDIRTAWSLENSRSKSLVDRKMRPHPTVFFDEFS